ncbi:MAG TPA: ATP-binding protein [Bacteroidales bacterium]|nr:ATP-binding protein [Bacteroidales bacterium]
MITNSLGNFFKHILRRSACGTYKQVFDKAGYAIMLVDNATNRFLKANRAASELFGYTEKEFLKMTPLDLATDGSEKLSFIGKKTEESVIRPARRKDGRIITIKVQISYMENYLISLISDVTEEYRIRRALELNEERLREAQRLGRFGWWEYRPETKRFIGSEEISKIFQDEASTFSLSYQENIVYTHPEDRSFFLSMIQDVLEKKNEYYSLSYRIITPNGQVKTVAIIANFNYDENGRLLYANGTCQDISETQKIMDDLIAARRQAEESDRLKTTFLANFSHEIRTPLNAILGFLNILTSLATTEREKEEMVKLIEINSQRLLRLINDMIDMSRIESNSMEIKYTNVEISRFVKSMISNFTHELETAEKNHLKLIPVVDDTKIAVYQYIDELRLSQIFSNLVSNAIKFTNQGEIKYGYRISRADERYSITYFVTDTGQGIMADKLDDIFKPFVQFWDKDTPKVQGAGLGLAICKRLVELMKGRIWVESLPGKGSSFLFSFTTPVMIE